MTEANTQHHIHADHAHRHGPACGHTPVLHDGHTDYLHEGHLHHPHEDHFDEHAVAVSESNPDTCTPSHACSGHIASHRHDDGCGHDAVQHGNHTDYLVAGHLHHDHDGHCDDHGVLRTA